MLSSVGLCGLLHCIGFTVVLYCFVLGASFVCLYDLWCVQFRLGVGFWGVVDLVPYVGVADFRLRLGCCLLFVCLWHMWFGLSFLAGCGLCV